MLKIWSMLALVVGLGLTGMTCVRHLVARGYDVTQYTLQCFGGAGGLEARLPLTAIAPSDRMPGVAGEPCRARRVTPRADTARLTYCEPP